MAYSQGPYARFTSLPSPGPSTLTSSRKIDFESGRYVTTEDGGFEAMDDIAQRACLLVCFGVKPQKFVTPQSLASTEQDIRLALQPMTAAPAPEIEILTVTAERTAAGKTTHLVEFRVLATGTKTTVEIP